MHMNIVPEVLRSIVTKPGFVQYVRHAYWLGGYDIRPGTGIELDEYGLEWMRTVVLRHYKVNVEYQMIEPEDLSVILEQHPTYDEVVEMYGRPVSYESYKEWRHVR